MSAWLHKSAPRSNSIWKNSEQIPRSIKVSKFFSTRKISMSTWRSHKLPSLTPESLSFEKLRNKLLSISDFLNLSLEHSEVLSFLLHVFLCLPSTATHTSPAFLRELCIFLSLCQNPCRSRKPPTAVHQCPHICALALSSLHTHVRVNFWSIVAFRYCGIVFPYIVIIWHTHNSKVVKHRCYAHTNSCTHSTALLCVHDSARPQISA